MRGGLTYGANDNKQPCHVRVHGAMIAGIILGGEIGSASHPILPRDGIVFHVGNIQARQPVGPHELVHDDQGPQKDDQEQRTPSREASGPSP